QSDVAAEVEEERLVVEAVGDLVDRMVALQEGGHLCGKRVELVEDELDLVRWDRLAHLGELERDQREQRDLGGERLRRRDPALEAAAREERGVALGCDL